MLWSLSRDRLPSMSFRGYFCTATSMTFTRQRSSDQPALPRGFGHVLVLSFVNDTPDLPSVPDERP